MSLLPMPHRLPRGHGLPRVASDQVAGAGFFFVGVGRLHDLHLFAGSTIKETVGSIDLLDKR